MPPTLTQVFKTYTTRPLWWWLAAFGGWEALLFSGVMTEGLYSSLVVSAAVLPACLMEHLKSQFSSPRSRLTPGFALPHLVIAGAVFFTAVAIPALLAKRTGMSVAATLGLSLALHGVMLWAMFRFAFWSLLLAVVPFFTMLYPVERPVGLMLAEPLLKGERPLAAAAVAILGLAAAGRVAIGLARITEDHPAFLNHFRVVTRSDTHKHLARSLRERAGGWAFRPFSLMEDRLVDRLPEPDGDGSFLSRLKLWRIALRGGARLEFWMPAGIFAFATLIVLIEQGAGRDMFRVLWCIAVMLSPIFSGLGLLGRRQFGTTEWLRPQSRGGIVWNVFSAALFETVRIYLLSVGALAAALIPWGGLPPGAGGAVVCGLAFQVFFIAVVTWLTSFRSSGAYVAFGLWFAFAPASSVLIANYADARPATALAAALSLPAAATIFLLAHRRWCRIEMG